MNLVLAIVFLVLLSSCAAAPPPVTPSAGPTTSTKALPDNAPYGIVQDAFGQWRIGTEVEGSTLLCVILVDGDKDDACISIQDLRNFVKEQTK
jgi:hypothetical protein